MGEIIRKTKNGKFVGWYIRYIDADGKRKQRASKQPTHAEARKLLVEIEARVLKGKVGIEEARAKEVLTFSELMERFLLEYSRPKIKDIQRYRRGARNSLQRLLPTLGNKQISEITPNLVAKARDMLNLAPGTIRQTFIVAGALFSWAVKEGMLEKNPIIGLEKPSAVNSLEWLTTDDVRKLMGYFDTHTSIREQLRKAAVSLGLYAGLRKGEIFGLRWQDVDFAGRRLTIARSYDRLPKNGQIRHIRLPMQLAPIIQAWKAICPHTEQGLVCPTLYKGKWGMANERASQGIKVIFKRAGCARMLRPWHALRHTFASNFVMHAGNILALQKILGHGDIKMTLIYAHLAPDFLGEEMEKVRY